MRPLPRVIYAIAGIVEAQEISPADSTTLMSIVDDCAEAIEAEMSALTGLRVNELDSHFHEKLTGVRSSVGLMLGLPFGDDYRSQVRDHVYTHLSLVDDHLGKAEASHA